MMPYLDTKRIRAVPWIAGIALVTLMACDAFGQRGGWLRADIAVAADAALERVVIEETFQAVPGRSKASIPRLLTAEVEP